ncbi:MAG: threonylcarbamoyl-AMP synthase [Elusimicrobia bacterium]|nr:threonylcarbamoyl-AMP synthase [Elusimicrobiota bacterium]MBU2615035.1 threonylcarbamoyl-AMP synthase [Elusimicrobiota bacterium]
MKLLKIDYFKPEKEKIALAAETIKKGGTVIFPTETVYGIGVDALNPEAVKKVFELKGRPQNNPLTIHIANKQDIIKIAWNIPDYIFKIINKFMPGPLTIVLLKNKDVSDLVTAGRQTVGIRMPDHPVAFEFIKESGSLIAAPSANFSGKKSPQSIQEIPKKLLEKADIVLDSGPALTGMPSTVVDFTVSPPKILRQGAITMEDLKRII